MSQLEQNFRELLLKNPEIEKCYSYGLVNRRALARYLIEKKIIKRSGLDAAVAMLRRYEFRKSEPENFSVFSGMRTSIKDNLVILSFKKDHDISVKLGQIASQTDYSISETLKIIVGSANITIILDEEKEKQFSRMFDRSSMIGRTERISEISILFPEEAIDTKGIIAVISNLLFMNGITISEMLTASSELLLYFSDENVIKAYGLIKGLK